MRRAARRGWLAVALFVNAGQLVACASRPAAVAPSCSEKNSQLCLDEAFRAPLHSIQRLSALRTGCRGKLVRACLQLGAEYAGDRSSFNSALDGFDTACTLGSGKGCRESTLLRLRHRGRLSDPDSEAKIKHGFERGCELDDLPSCGYLGARHARAGRIGEATALLDRSCGAAAQLKKKDADQLPHLLEACNALAPIMVAGQNPGGAKRAAELMASSCASGSTPGCVWHGRYLRDGIGQKADPTRAVTVFQRACDTADDAGCVSLAGMFSRGVGTTKDERRAHRLLSAACEKRYQPGCLELEDLLTKRGPPRWARSYEYVSSALLSKLFSGAPSWRPAADDVITVICRVVLKRKRDFKLEWQLGPWGRGHDYGYAQGDFVAAPGVQLMTGDRLEFGGSVSKRGLSLGSEFLPIPVPFFGSTKTWKVTHHQVEFDGGFPVQHEAKESWLECRAPSEAQLLKVTAGSRKELGVLGKRLAKKPWFRARKEDLGYADSGAGPFRSKLADLAALLGWRHPKVQEQLQLEHDFDQRWRVVVRGNLAQLGRRASTKPLRLDNGLLAQPKRVNCDRKDDASYWTSQNREAMCVLEVELHNPTGAPVTLDVRPVSRWNWQLVRPDGAQRRLSLASVQGPDGKDRRYDYELELAPGNKLLVVLKVHRDDGEPEAERWGRLLRTKDGTFFRVGNR